MIWASFAGTLSCVIKPKQKKILACIITILNQDLDAEKMWILSTKTEHNPFDTFVVFEVKIFMNI